MTVVADITVPADAFVLGRVLSDFPDVEIELERVVPLDEPPVPLFWVSGSDTEAVEDALREHPRTETIEQLTTSDDAALFEVHWDSETDGFLRALIDAGAKVLEGLGTAESWDFRLRFRSHEHLSAFNVALTSDDVPVTLRHIYDSNPPADQATLSSERC